ncbi:MAG: FHA domain-containing protein, partial [Woeseia sp.]|nr:FHA domain-containing protein [Woeseia sp.]MBT8096083.1 FHA domain-containing protein [Woeseia sp.]
MFARLTIYQPDHPARQFLLDNNESYLIGRDDACAMHVDDDRLSRRHARLEFTSDNWRLVDLCSKNGTLLAGRPIAQCDLAGEQWIELGGVLACFDEVSSEHLAEEEQRFTERWQTSVHLSRAITPSTNLDELLQSVLQSFIEVAGAERGFVMLGSDFDSAQSDAGFPEAGANFAGSLSVVRRTYAERRPIVCSDVRTDSLLVEQASIVAGKISALVSMPLEAGGVMQGLIYVDSREPGKQFTDLDMDILEALAHHASMVIGVSRLREDIVD